MPRKRLWFLGLILAAAIAAIAFSPALAPLNVLAQAPTPAPAASPADPAASPEPTLSPDPAASPSPALSPTPAVSPEPTLSPDPAASPSPAPSPTTTLQPAALPLAPEPYQDPGQRFQLGVIDGYQSNVVAGVPLFESPDGTLAYTVAVRPRANDATVDDASLAQVAIETFARGEGLQPGAFEPEPTGGAKVPWTGTLTTGKTTQPMQGAMLARQVPGRLLILMVAATEEAAGQIEPVYATLAPTLLPALASPNPEG